jgi:putative flavoprotein involved in K+ transport
MDSVEVVIIGAGQAGLAMGHHLARRGVRFVILDAAPEVGHSWRARWDSLKLFTPAAYSALPGLAFPGDPARYPAREEVAAYLQEYARHFDLPIRLNEPVVELTAAGDGYAVRTAEAVHHASRVVVATGPFQRPAIPALASRVTPSVVQIHSSAYRNPAGLPAGEVLVVGAGNSGVQIAEELAASRPVTLAVGQRLPRLPESLLGRSIFWWLERSGAMEVTRDSWLGRRMRERETLIGSSPAMLARSAGVRRIGRVDAVEGATLRTSAGEAVSPAAIVWATGFRDDYAWLRVPVLDAAGRPIHRRGVTAAPGLYFLGLPWQHTRGSALIGWVGRDAAVLAEHIVRPRLSV